MAGTDPNTGSIASGDSAERPMAHVSVTINGRQYRMACEDGQEAHVLRLAKDLDLRIEKLRGRFGEIGDMRLVVMAAITVADELIEAGKRMRQLEDELAGMHDAGAVTTERSRATQAAIAAALNSAAARIWPGPWARTYGAHLRCRYPGSNAPTASAAPHLAPSGRIFPQIPWFPSRRANLAKRSCGAMRSRAGMPFRPRCGSGRPSAWPCGRFPLRSLTVHACPGFFRCAARSIRCRCCGGSPTPARDSRCQWWVDAASPWWSARGRSARRSGA